MGSATRDHQAMVHSLCTSRDVQEASLPSSGQTDNAPLSNLSDHNGEIPATPGDKRTEMVLDLWKISEIYSRALSRICVANFVKYN